MKFTISEFKAWLREQPSMQKALQTLTEENVAAVSRTIVELQVADFQTSEE